LFNLKYLYWCNRIVRAFLIEEQKIVKRLTKENAPEELRKKRMLEKQKAAQQKREKEQKDV
jgi:hypothetical protein